MKKQYVKGYAPETSRTEKITFGLLILICIAAAVVTLVAVSVVRKGAKNDETVNFKENRQVVENIAEDIYDPVEEIEQETVAIEESVETIAKGTDDAEELIVADVFSPPCYGNIIKEYSPFVPIYSETLDDWRVHNGIDIHAPLGEEVCAVADGVVSNTTEDFRYGFTITIDHGNGIKSTYSNLSGTDMVKTGRNVKRGEVISTVGDSSLFETVADTHIHFEITKDGKYEDPLKYFYIES